MVSGVYTDRRHQAREEATLRTAHEWPSQVTADFNLALIMTSEAIGI